MTPTQLQTLRSLPIEHIAQRLGMTVRHHKTLCPFHDDTHPSLSFSTRRNTYRCFVCGASGDTIDLVKHRLGMDFVSACRWLGGDSIINSVATDTHWSRDKQSGWQTATFDATRYERYFERPWLSSEAQHFLYTQRRLDPRVISWCRVTSCRDANGTPWLQIPYYNQEMKLIGLQNRNLTPEGKPRFRFPYGASCSVYNLPILKHLSPSEPLYITEGASDCWAMLSSGHKAIAIPSATLLLPSDHMLLRQIEQQGHPMHMYPDRDEPGERLFMQLSDIIPSLQHHHLPPGCKDFSEYHVRLKTGGTATSDGSSDNAPPISPTA